MQRAALLFNPVSGRGRDRARAVDDIALALRHSGVQTSVIPTCGPNTAGTQAAALAKDNDILFACGGDGTIHEVIQGLAHHPACSMGIIPLGSANVLARHMGLSLDPLQAARQQLQRHPAVVPLGRITYATGTGRQSRYFLVMAGAGPDGALVYSMASRTKQRWGRTAYYARAAAMFATSRFPPFQVDCMLDTGETVTRQAAAIMAVRVNDLGGLFSPLARGGDILHPHLQITLAKAPAALSLPAWFAMSTARLHRLNPLVETHNVSMFACHASAVARRTVHVQADGEWLGTTPMSATIVPAALRLLLS